MHSDGLQGQDVRVVMLQRECKLGHAKIITALPTITSQASATPCARSTRRLGIYTTVLDTLLQTPRTSVAQVTPELEPNAHIIIIRPNLAAFTPNFTQIHLISPIKRSVAIRKKKNHLQEKRMHVSLKLRPLPYLQSVTVEGKCTYTDISRVLTTSFRSLSKRAKLSIAIDLKHFNLELRITFPFLYQNIWP